MTYQVFTKDGITVARCHTLDKAMEEAKVLGQFVTIRSPDGMEIAGMFGVAPPPEDYEWKKDFSPYRNKAKKVMKRDADERDASQDEN